MYLTIAVTGVISSLARGSNQCAIAHKVYETSRTLYPEEVHDWLHGELVAIGMICQMAYNGESEEAVSAFKQQMCELGMPVALSQIGVPTDDASMDAYYEKIVNSSALAGVSDDEKARFRKALELIR